MSKPTFGEETLKGVENYLTNKGRVKTRSKKDNKSCIEERHPEQTNMCVEVCDLDKINRNILLVTEINLLRRS